MGNITIELFNPNDFIEVANVVATAMVTNPTMKAVFRGIDENEKKQRLSASFEILFKYAPSETHIARIHNKIVGVVRISSSPYCLAPPPEAGQLLEPLMKKALKSSYDRHNELFSVWIKNDLKEPHLHLGPNAVLPDFQGQGIATQVLSLVCKRIDSEGKTAFLETDKIENVRLYSRFGFTEVNQTTEPFGVTSYFMRRSPKS